MHDLRNALFCVEKMSTTVQTWVPFDYVHRSLCDKLLGLLRGCSSSEGLSSNGKSDSGGGKKVLGAPVHLGSLVSNGVNKEDLAGSIWLNKADEALVCLMGNVRNV